MKHVICMKGGIYTYLSELIEVVKVIEVRLAIGSMDGAEIMGLSYDSRRVKKGDAFFCKGEGFVARYAEEAEKKGCACLIYSAETENEVLKARIECPVLRVESIRRSMALGAAHFYGYPFERLKSIAVTGTKGKTTVTGLIDAILNKSDGVRCAILSELVTSDAPRLTTHESIDIHRAAAEAVRVGCTHIVCEISSQAMKHERVYGIRFDIGCFTNYGRDHISPMEHSCEAEYLACKAALLDQCASCVINVDDTKGAQIYRSLGVGIVKKSFSFKENEADYYVSDVHTDDRGSELTVLTRGRGNLVVTGMMGGFNAENAAMAAAVGMECGADERAVFCGVFGYMPSGRGVVIDSADGKVRVIVDYAHNGLSFEAIFKELVSRDEGAIVTAIFGCPGEKAYCRRAQLANIAAMYADKVIICEDDSGNEGYESISKELKRHFEAAFEQKPCRLKRMLLSFIEKRDRALAAALENARMSGGKHTVLFLGKGDERFNRGCGCDERCEDDISVARSAIEDYDLQSELKTVLAEIPGVKGKRTLVSIGAGDNVARQLAASLGTLVGIDTEVYVICERESLETIRELCYKEGVGVLDASEADMEAVRGAARSGIVPIFAVNDRKKSVFAITGAMKFDHLVYLESGEGIIFNGNSLPCSVTLRRARVILRMLPSNEAEGAISVFKHGVETVAVLDGRRRNALASFLCGGGVMGTVVRRDA